MRYLVHAILFISLLQSGCIGNNGPNAKIDLNVITINFCHRPVGETVVWNDVQIRNLGRDNLTISKMAIRGNATCAFEVSYPKTGANGKTMTASVPAEANAKNFSSWTIPASGAALIRVAYTPSAVGETDRADLLIESDSAKLDTQLVVVPMCGTGAAPASSEVSDAGDMPDASVPTETDVDDAGEADEATPECEACGARLKKGAPSCQL